MHVAKFLHPFCRRTDIEFIVPSLPNVMRQLGCSGAPGLAGFETRAKPQCGKKRSVAEASSSARSTHSPGPDPFLGRRTRGSCSTVIAPALPPDHASQIAMQIAKFFHPFWRRTDIEVIVPRLPNVSWPLPARLNPHAGSYQLLSARVVRLSSLSHASAHPVARVG